MTPQGSMHELPPNATRDEVLATLTPRQRAVLEDVRVSKLQKERAVLAYAEKLLEAHDEHGLTWGVMGHTLGELRENLWKYVDRHIGITKGKRDDNDTATSVVPDGDSDSDSRA